MSNIHTKTRIYTAVVLSLLFLLSGITNVLADDSILTGTSQGSGNNSVDNSTSSKTDQLIVTFVDPLPADNELMKFSSGAVDRLTQAAGMELRLAHTMTGGAVAVKLPSRMGEAALQEVIQKLSAMPGVELV
jgi:hypothetical protein